MPFANATNKKENKQTNLQFNQFQLCECLKKHTERFYSQIICYHANYIIQTHTFIYIDPTIIAQQQQQPLLRFAQFSAIIVSQAFI